MPIYVVRFGTARAPEEGVRLGTVRRPPRGVRKEDYAKLDYFDVWLPELAPSAPLVDFALSEPFTLKRWAEYDKRYRAEMKKPLLSTSSRRSRLCRRTPTSPSVVTAKTHITATARS